MHIRKRVDADNTALVDLWERSVRATHDFLSEADIVELYPQVRDLYLPAVEVWVLVDDDGVAQGFIGLSTGSPPTGSRRCQCGCSRTSTASVWWKAWPAVTRWWWTATRG